MEEQLRRINDKLLQLLRQYQHLQKDHDRLQKLVQVYEEKHQQQHQQAEALNQQVMVLKAATGQMNEADRAAFEKKLNQYIRQVEKCINYLSE